jgi:hypothetical protein
MCRLFYIIIYIFYIIYILYYSVCIATCIDNVLVAYGVPNMTVGCGRLPTLDTSTTHNFKCVTPFWNVYYVGIVDGRKLQITLMD